MRKSEQAVLAKKTILFMSQYFWEIFLCHNFTFRKAWFLKDPPIDRTRKARANFFSYPILENRKKKMTQNFWVSLIETLSKNYALPIINEIVVGKISEERGMPWFDTFEGVMEFSSLNSSLLVFFFYILGINWSSEEKK